MFFNIEELRNNIDKLKVAVIGDYCLDQYWYMDSRFDKKLDYNDDITFALTNIVYYPGGAGNVANNFAKLGADVKCIGLIGDDGHGYQLIKCLKNTGANVENMLKSQNKETHTCVRPIRLIEGDKIALNEIITSKFVNTGQLVEFFVKNILNNIINDVDALVMVEQFDDNNKGIFTDSIRREIMHLSKIHEDKIFIVDSRKYINKYENIYLKCNQSEFAETFKKSGFKKSGLVDLSRDLNDLKDFKALFITRGKAGIKVIGKNRYMDDVPAIKVSQEVNTCGAGDSATVGIVLGLYSGYDIKQAAMLGNIMASITIKDLESTGYPTYETLIETLKYNNLIELGQ